MTLSIPASMDSNGTFLVLLCSAIADMSNPTITETTAGTVVDLTCYLTGEGFAPSVSENSVEDTRLCTKQNFQSPGDFTEELEITYVYNNFDEAEDQARINLTAGVSKFIVVRYGLDPADTISVGDPVDVYSFKAGKQRKNTPARNAVHTITQKLFLNEVTRHDVAIHS